MSDDNLLDWKFTRRQFKVMPFEEHKTRDVSI